MKSCEKFWPVDSNYIKCTSVMPLSRCNEQPINACTMCSGVLVFKC